MSTISVESLFAPARLAYRLRRLLRDQWLPLERVRDIQRAKMRNIIRHAYEHVLYYRRLLDDSGVTPEEIQNVHDLARLPITTKQQLMAQPRADVIADIVDPKRTVTQRTSGSLGMPFDVIFRPQDREWWGLLELRGWMANRYHRRLRTLVLTDSRSSQTRRAWFEYLGLFRRTYASIHDGAERQVETARAVRPEVIKGMPSDLFLLAQAVREQKVTEVAPKVLFTSAELLDDGARKSINDTFGVQLADFYGSMECGWIAWECPSHAGYHINVDCLVVEFLRDGKPVSAGEPGEVVVTNLHNFAMPFIRYSVGDVGIPLGELCPCGRGLPLMKTVEGRTIECLTLPDGRLISPYRLTCTVGEIPGIYRYQIEQSSPSKLTVKIIPGHDFGEGTLHGVREELEQLLEHSLDVEPVIARELQKDRSGKFRVVKGLSNTPQWGGVSVDVMHSVPHKQPSCV